MFKNVVFIVSLILFLSEQIIYACEYSCSSYTIEDTIKNTESIASYVVQHKPKKICGICLEEIKGDAALDVWNTIHTNFAHRYCKSFIEPFEEEHIKEEENLFSYKTNDIIGAWQLRESAKKSFRGLLQAAAFPDSLLSYNTTYGENFLKGLIDIIRSERLKSFIHINLQNIKRTKL